MEAWTWHLGLGCLGFSGTYAPIYTEPLYWSRLWFVIALGRVNLQARSGRSPGHSQLKQQTRCARLPKRTQIVVNQDSREGVCKNVARVSVKSERFRVRKREATCKVPSEVPCKK
jgi:hypothetical protein